MKSFPAEVRFTGFALSYNVAYAVFGGTAPAIASFLVGKQGITMAPMWYVAALCVLGLLIGLVWKAPNHGDLAVHH